MRVLLVEDDDVDAEVIRRSLNWNESPLIRLHRCHSLAEAVERVGRQGFDAILLDLALPDSQGLSTIERMVDAAPDVPVIVLSAERNLTTQVQAAAVRAHDFLAKNELGRSQLQRSLTYAAGRKRAVSRLMEQERLAALGRLAAGIGHELKNPVSYIFSNLQVLQEDLQRFAGPPLMEVPAATLGEWKEAVSDCLVGAEQLKLLGDSLNALRTEGRAQASCELGEAVRRGVAVMDHAVRPWADLQVEGEIAGEVQGELGALVSVLVHLLRRAVLGFEERSGERGRIVLRSPPSSQGQILEIEDDGPSIAPERRRVLFDLYPPPGRELVPEELGLTVAHQICREWGWDLGYDGSKEGQTLFRLAFPPVRDA